MCDIAASFIRYNASNHQKYRQMKKLSSWTLVLHFEDGSEQTVKGVETTNIQPAIEEILATGVVDSVASIEEL